MSEGTGWTGALAGGPVAPPLEPGPAPGGGAGQPGVPVAPAAPTAPGASSEPVSFDPIVGICFLAILLAVCWQNWALARRAEGASVIPDWLRSRRHRETR
jgi:hypothetical protein